MNRLFPLLALGLLLIAMGPVQAQEAAPMGDGEAILEQVLPALRTTALTPDEALDEAGALLRATGRPDYDDALLQVGAGANLVVIDQQGTGNQIDVEQRGAANVAVFVQYGASNESDLLQDGTLNVYGVRFDGDANSLGVTQVGSRNVYLLDFTGTASGAHEVLQIGEGNQLVQLGVGAVPFSVTQRGTDMGLVIEHYGAGAYESGN